MKKNKKLESFQNDLNLFESSKLKHGIIVGGQTVCFPIKCWDLLGNFVTDGVRCGPIIAPTPPPPSYPV